MFRDINICICVIVFLCVCILYFLFDKGERRTNRPDEERQMFRDINIKPYIKEGDLYFKAIKRAKYKI